MKEHCCLQGRGMEVGHDGMCAQYGQTLRAEVVRLSGRIWAVPSVDAWTSPATQQDQDKTDLE